MKASERDKEKMRGYSRRPEVRERQKARIRERRLAVLYGLTPLELEHLLLDQGGVCAICKTDKFGKNGPCVDHEHKTGKVRGILCSKCNSAVAFLDDDPNRAIDLADYLVKSRY